ncbi:hypothetical protein ABIA33_007551 [Streptacidiphilus sp. MAP12-16]|uniref:hypothetical protein n=1 Tax=Streptacidiphilus sp. MAP12-16 TaxID=3156300 RepID=UPI0035123207
MPTAMEFDWAVISHVSWQAWALMIYTGVAVNGVAVVPMFDSMDAIGRGRSATPPSKKEQPPQLTWPPLSRPRASGCPLYAATAQLATVPIQLGGASAVVVRQLAARIRERA